MIFFSEYKSNLGKMFTWFLFLLIMVSMLMLAYPVFNDPSVAPIVLNNLDLIPQSISSVIFPLGISVFSDFYNYLLTVMVFIQFIVCVFALNIGLSSLAKEQGFGTIDYLYINPVSRDEIVLKKYIANVINFLILTILAYSLGIGLYSYLGEYLTLEIFRSNLPVLTIIFLEGLLFLSFGTMISALSKRTSGLNTVATLIFFIVLLINIFISLEVIDTGFLNSMIPLRALQLVDFNYPLSLYFIIIVSKILPSAVMMIVAVFAYNKKDLIV